MDYTSLGTSNGAAPDPDQQTGLRGIAVNALDRIKSVLPDVGDVYVQPLDPGSELSISDRASLVMQSMRPWGEFLDISTFNLPTLEETNKRVGHNIRTYFYNYFLLACVHMIFFAIGHFGSVLTVLLWSALMWFMYGYRPDDIDVAGMFTLNDKGKLAVAIITGVVAIAFGHVLTLVFSLTVFLLIVMGVHSLIRDNTMDAIEPVI